MVGTFGFLNARYLLRKHFYKQMHSTESKTIFSLCVLGLDLIRIYFFVCSSFTVLSNGIFAFVNNQLGGVEFRMVHLAQQRVRVVGSISAY